MFIHFEMKVEVAKILSFSFLKYVKQNMFVDKFIAIYNEIKMAYLMNH
jgi:hypothetical protein